MIRPQLARWFEILVARDDATLALEALAATNATELEARPSVGLPPALASLRPLLQRYAEHSLRYHAYWPTGEHRRAPFSEPPAATLTRCLERIAAWEIDALPTIERLQHAATEREELVVWQHALTAMADSAIDLAYAAASGPIVQAYLFVYAPEGEPNFPFGLLVRRFEIDGVVHALAVGTESDLRSVALQLDALRGRTYSMPAWLQSDTAANAAYLSSRIEALDREAAELATRLQALGARHDLGAMLGEAERLHWVIENVHALDSGPLFCWITGWTSELSGERLAQALERSGARAILRYAPAPTGTIAPLILANPAWARPFEVFSRALGMPARNEADPTTLLAFVVPAMFGYMFGDVGQGLVIAAVGFALRDRWPLARLFVAGGIGATFFGVLFGSAFSLQGVIHPLWVEPLDDPLSVLLVPLYGGAVLLTVGLLLGAIEAYWRGELRGWFCSELWLAIVYVALLIGVARAGVFWVAAAGAAAFCLGRAASARSASAGFAAIAEIIERTLQILINTLSFSRVGAFALAHAGLSSAIVALMEASGSVVAKAIVLIVGNLVVLVLEGMVVSIQTTRLVLFEFFTRFLVAPGRTFRPLPAPPFVVKEH
jgi:V/A-type H+-transporting ATPase subunit I